ncbi:MAG: serine/threonine-protein kinase, partial [Bacteroidota bacterium]
YKALDQASGEIVLLKQLRAVAPDQRQRFEAEAQLAARVDHPNVVRVLSVAEDALITEWVEGADLNATIERTGGLPPALATLVLHEAARGLAAVHDAGILHRDVSAANVLLGADGAVKLTDFGLASLAGEADREVRGTLGTLAPEAVRGDSVTPAADLFSLGAVLVHALTGRTPFAADASSGTLDAVLHTDPTEALIGDPRFPAPLVEIAASLLAKDPTDRPGSAAAAADQLAVVLDGFGTPDADDLATFLETPSAYRPARFVGASSAFPTIKPPAAPDRPPAPAGPSRRPSTVALASIAALGAAVLALGLLNRTTDSPDPIVEEPPAVLPVEVAERPDTDSLAGTADEPLVAASTAPPLAPEVVPVTPEAAPTEPQTAPDDPPAPSPSAPAADPPRQPAETAPPPPATGRLVVSSQPWASVEIDGQTRRTPFEIELAPGIYSLQFRNPGLPAVREQVTVSAGGETQAAVRLLDRLAEVTLDIRPWAVVTVNGAERGTTPELRSLYLAPGEHTIRFVHPQLGETTRTVSATAGASQRLTVLMTQE